MSRCDCVPIFRFELGGGEMFLHAGAVFNGRVRLGGDINSRVGNC